MSTTTTANVSKCAVCGESATKICSGCNAVGYCSRDHQKEDWPKHKQVCQQKHKQQSTTQPSTSLQTTRQQQSSEIAVTWSDQQNINLFSRLNLKLQNLLDELKLKQSDLANTKDALNDIENLLDDDVGTCKIKIGDVYVDVTNEDAEQFANKYKYNLQLEVDNLNHKSDEIKQTMNELKNKLYKKFGNQINLEYEEGLTSS